MIATHYVAGQPDLPSANQAVLRGSRRAILKAKNRNFRRVNLRDSMGDAQAAISIDYDKHGTFGK